MRERALTVAVTLAAACYGGSAQLPPPMVPHHPTAEEWQTADAVVTDETATLTYEKMTVKMRERYVGVLEHRLQIKILRPEGLHYAKFELPLDAYTSVSHVVARSVDQFGNVSNMDPDAPIAVNRTQRGQVAPELKTLIFEVSDAEVGGVIDVLYTRVFTAADLVPPWVFGGPLPKLRSEYSIVFGPDTKIDHRFGRGARIVDEQPLRRELPDGSTRLVFVQQDIPAYFAEPRGPHISWSAPWVATVITSGHKNGKTIRMNNWSDVGDRLTKMFASVGGGPLEGTLQERYAQVRDSIKPLSDIGLGIRPPKSASSLLGGTPACTRDAGALLYNSLKGSSAKVYPALITGPRGPAVSEGFPSLYGFIHVAVAVDVRDDVANDPTCKEDPVSRGLLCSIPQDSYAFLDPVCSACRYGELPTELTGGRALILLSGDDPVWVDIPTDAPERNRTMMQFHYALDVDGSLAGTMNGETTGVLARRIRSEVPLETKGGGLDRATAELLAGPKPIVGLHDVEVGALSDVDDPLTLTAQVSAKAETLAYEKFRINPLEVFGPALPGHYRRSRRSAAILDAPAWYETAASIQLPIGYDVLEDPVAKLVTPFAEYASGFALRERTLNFSRRLVLKKHVIAADEWQEFRDFLDRIDEIERNGIPVFLSEGVDEPGE